MGEKIRGKDFVGAWFHGSTFIGASFRDSDLRGVTIRASWVEGMRVDGVHGEVEQVFVNGIDVSPYVTSELDRLFPERVAVRSVPTAADRRTVWARLDERWDETIARGSARHDAYVGGEWSLKDTVRYLVFAHDCWRGQMLLDGGPFQRGLPNTDLTTERTGTPAPAWGEETHTVANCVDTLMREHSEHRRFIERDLARILEEG
jgi:hypothetical protein